MGEVYRARDVRLERTVALKVLRPEIAAGTEARLRFEREARAISALQHPHICTLHDVGRHGETEFLVMELLEGETLAQRLARGPLPADQLLRYGIEIAAALALAHRHGVVHRDLKPGNVMLTRSGVKLLDFGLAKTKAPAASTAELPTVLATSGPLTAAGSLLGTFQYMAPEQLEGKEADARSDLFALGAVLYEMATGRPAFEGKSQASLISAIMTAHPAPIAQVEPMAPAALDRLVRACLAKDPDERWQSALDVATELGWIAAGDAPKSAPARGSRREIFAWSAAALGALAAIVVAALVARRPEANPQALRFSVAPPAGAVFNSEDAPVTLAPDGSRYVHRLSGNQDLLVQDFAATAPVTLLSGQNNYDPFWSPDGRFVGFFTTEGMSKVSAGGGPLQRLAAASDGRGATWGARGLILYAPQPAGGLFVIGANGGEPRQVTRLDADRGEIGHWRPWFLPDGRHFLYVVNSLEADVGGVYLGDLDSDLKRRILVGDAPRYGCGHIVYLDGRQLVAQAFSAERLVTEGAPAVVAEGLEYYPQWGNAPFSVSAAGNCVLAFHPSAARAAGETHWIDPDGTARAIASGVGDSNLDVSPDGARLAMQGFDERSRAQDIWIVDLARGVRSRLTFERFAALGPVWSPDGSRLAYSKVSQGGWVLVDAAASGAGARELEVRGVGRLEAVDWSPDGRFLLYEGDAPETSIDLYALDLNDPQAKPLAIATSRYLEANGRFSPDGRTIAYSSDETGREEIFLQPFPPGAGKLQVTSAGGTAPRWHPGGRQLFYVSNDNQLMAVDLRGAGDAFRPGTPRQLFAIGTVDYDVAPDGRFLARLRRGEAGAPIQVIVHWPQVLTTTP
jgi:Tol biopolymer transport system component